DRPIRRAQRSLGEDGRPAGGRGVSAIEAPGSLSAKALAPQAGTARPAGDDGSPLDVALVLMPWAEVRRPSIALGLLKAALRRAGLRAAVDYANLRFAEEVGPDAAALVQSGRV